MKDLFEILFIKIAGGVLKNIFYVVGAATVALFMLSQMKEYNFITKYIVTLTLTH